MNLKQSPRLEANEELWNKIEADREISQKGFLFEGYKVAALFSLIGLVVWFSLSLGDSPEEITLETSETLEFYTLSEEESDEYADEYAFVDEFYQNL